MEIFKKYVIENIISDSAIFFQSLLQFQ